MTHAARMSAADGSSDATEAGARKIPDPMMRPTTSAEASQNDMTRRSSPGSDPTGAGRAGDADMRRLYGGRGARATGSRGGLDPARGRPVSEILLGENPFKIDLDR